MDITRENIDELNAVIKVKLGPEDYVHKVEHALKEVQKKVNMPGFRPGKVPVQLVRKMYGKSVLADEMNKILNDSLYKYISDNGLELLGNPMPSQDENANIDWENQKEFEFKYDIGLAPQFTVEISAKDKFSYYRIKADDALIDKYVNDMAKRYGKIVHPESSAKDDLVNGDFVELDAAGAILPGGIFKTVSVFTEKIKGDSLIKALSGLKKDDKVVIRAADMKDDAEYLAGLLHTTADKIASADFQFTVKDINRLEPSEINQELFDKVYGKDAVKSTEEFRERIKSEIERMFVSDSEKRFKTDVVKALMEKVKLRLPDEFLKRWIISTNEKPISKEQLEAEYPAYAEQMKWQLIENRILKEKQIKVSSDEALAYTKELVLREMMRYGRTDMDDKSLTEMATKILQKEGEAKRIYDQLYDQRLMDVFKSTFTLEEKELPYEEFFKN
ncbi:MAG: trigger factor [Bacteroidota bacterium]